MLNVLKQLKNKSEIQRQAFFVQANQIVRGFMKPKTRMPDEDWERMEADQSKEKPNQKSRKPKREKDEYPADKKPDNR